MGRKSALTDAQWDALGDRYLAGESARSLAREFHITEAPIRARFKTQHKEIKTIANQILEAENALSKLPIKTQIKTLDYRDMMRSSQEDILIGTSYAARSFSKLQRFANEQVEQLDDSKTGQENIEIAKNAMIFTRAANEAATVPMALFNASKDMAKTAAQEVDITPDSTLTPEEEYLKFIE